MRAGQGSNVFIIAGCVALAVLIGAAVPLASGNQLGGQVMPWTPPPSQPTGVPSPTRVRSAAQATLSPTGPAVPVTSPTASPTAPAATSTPALPRPTLTPEPTKGLSATLSPTPTLTPTSVGTPQVSGAEPGLPASPTPAVPVAQVREGPLVMRTGPNTAYPILGLANIGDTFSVVGRDSTGQWLKVCCIRGSFAWVSANFVSVNATLNAVPLSQ